MWIVRFAAPALLLLLVGACAQPQPSGYRFGSRAIELTGPKPFIDTPDYAEFEGIQPETTEGRRRLLNLAARGNPLAMMMLGTVYVDGTSVAKDCDLAKYWFEQADNTLPALDASDGDKAALHSVVAIMLSSPEAGLRKWCAAGAPSTAAAVVDCARQDGSVWVMDPATCTAIGGTVSP